MCDKEASFIQNGWSKARVVDDSIDLVGTDFAWGEISSCVVWVQRPVGQEARRDPLLDKAPHQFFHEASSKVRVTTLRDHMIKLL